MSARVIERAPGGTGGRIAAPRAQRSAPARSESCANVRVALPPGPFVGDLAPLAAQRAWFARLLWQAFPADSERAVARLASPWLRSRGLRASESQVRNWLRCEHDAAFTVVIAVLSRVGASRFEDIIRRKRTA